MYISAIVPLCAVACFIWTAADLLLGQTFLVTEISTFSYGTEVTYLLNQIKGCLINYRVQRFAVILYVIS